MAHPIGPHFRPLYIKERANHMHSSRTTDSIKPSKCRPLRGVDEGCGGLQCAKVARQLAGVGQSANLPNTRVGSLANQNSLLSAADFEWTRRVLKRISKQSELLAADGSRDLQTAPDALRILCLWARRSCGIQASRIKHLQTARM